MKKYLGKLYLISIILVLSIGCGNSNNETSKSTPSKPKDSPKIQKPPYLSVVKLVFGVNKTVPEYSQPDENHPINDNVPTIIKGYSRYEVIDSLPGWYKIYAGYADVVKFIKKTDVIQETQIILNNEMINALDTNYDQSVSNDGDGENMRLKIISEEEFLKMQTTSANHVIFDSTRFKKTGKKLSITYLNKQRQTFKDDDVYQYSYVGQFPHFNSYIVKKEFIGDDMGDDPSEDATKDITYTLYNKNTGNEVRAYMTFPYLSNNKRYIINFPEHVFLRNNCTIHLHDLQTNKFYSSKMYLNWTPGHDTEWFWGSDGCFYLSITPDIANHLKYYASYPKKYNYRYVKVTIPDSSYFKEWR